MVTLCGFGVIFVYTLCILCASLVYILCGYHQNPKRGSPHISNKTNHWAFVEGKCIIVM